MTTAPVMLEDGVDTVVSDVVAAATLDDILVEDVVPEPVGQQAVPDRVDISGLLAIAARPPQRDASLEAPDAFPAIAWRSYDDSGDDGCFLMQHSA